MFTPTILLKQRPVIWRKGLTILRHKLVDQSINLAASPDGVSLMLRDQKHSRMSGNIPDVSQRIASMYNSSTVVMKHRFNSDEKKNVQFWRGKKSTNHEVNTMTCKGSMLHTAICWLGKKRLISALTVSATSVVNVTKEYFAGHSIQCILCTSYCMYSILYTIVYYTVFFPILNATGPC